MELLMSMFPGISSLFMQDPVIAGARIILIILGFILALYGYKRTLEPLIMVPMGIGMICINTGVLFLAGGETGTLFLNPMISDPAQLVNIMQVNFLQPIYNFTFSNSLVACMVFMGVGAMCEIGFILASPWTSIIIAIFAECGTFATLVLGVNLGLAPTEAAAVASIGGADGPMVLFTSLMLAPELFVPI
ncbi:MAG: sodium ion-translocating decarboxylase subunit beta, partial [Acidaminococcaceae bacterium]